MTPWSCSWTQRRQPKMAAYRLRQRIGRLEADQADLEKRRKVDEDLALQGWADRVVALLTTEELEELSALYDFEGNYVDLDEAEAFWQRVEARLGPEVLPDPPGGADGNRHSATAAGN